LFPFSSSQKKRIRIVVDFGSQSLLKLIFPFERFFVYSPFLFKLNLRVSTVEQ
jgi:hypothetical protein